MHIKLGSIYVVLYIFKLKWPTYRIMRRKPCSMKRWLGPTKRTKWAWKYGGMKQRPTCMVGFGFLNELKYWKIWRKHDGVLNLWTMIKPHKEYITFKEQQVGCCFLNLQMLQLTSQLDSRNLYNIMVHLFGETLAYQLLAKETMAWVQNGTHNVFCNCWWGWWLGFEEQWGKGMDLVFIIPYFTLVKRMDALNVFWQLTTSSKTICDEIEWISFLCLPQWRMKFCPSSP
jgi:hypothetical protein